MNQKVDARLDKINEHLDFDYSEFSEIEFDPTILNDLKANAYDCYERIYNLGQDLIREWQPFGDQEIPGWKDNYDLVLKEFQEHEAKIIHNANHARSFFKNFGKYANKWSSQRHRQQRHRLIVHSIGLRSWVDFWKRDS